jgi:hypothetical protein
VAKKLEGGGMRNGSKVLQFLHSALSVWLAALVHGCGLVTVTVTVTCPASRLLVVARTKATTTTS